LASLLANEGKLLCVIKIPIINLLSYFKYIILDHST